ncbi:hypothetical protein VaNZ11_017040 [Volvox africanus]|uniref:Uncharacterized protein n=1 Tax=Volvox africanus TaxID=51714 RepID=A0ABQ5SNY7_9CHLO|nr:hypothetical protein VaNZ11_017040 [Volvox africanus]
MERLSDSDSDDDDTYRRVGSMVLRPAVTTLPSIEDDNDTDGGDSSNETDVIFSNINWAAQESAGLLFDQELIHTRSSTVAVDANVPTGSKAWQFGANNGTDSDSDAHSSSRGGIDEAALPHNVTPRASDASASNVTAVSLSGTANVPLASSAFTYAPDRVGGAGPVWNVDPDEPYEGRGWLAGVAGRLANTADRRRAYAAATDAEQVADAARHAAALRQHRQQQRAHNHEAAKAGRAFPDGIIAAGDAGAAVMATDMDLQQQSQLEREEIEQLIVRDFYEAIQAAESEPPLVAPAELSLESSVAGLGVDDLDALIARLTAGTANLQPADCQGPTAATGAGGYGVGGDAKSQWFMQPLPAADSLWSDEEEESRIVRYGRIQPPGGAESRKAAVVTEARGPQVAGQAVSGPGSLLATAQLAGPLPAKFKFFAGPGGPAFKEPNLPLPPQGPSTASFGNGSGSGPVVQDLRPSIKETVQRNSREAAAAAAQRESQAKAAAARRRLTVSSDDSSPGGSSDDDNATTVKKIRPVPPAQVQSTPEPGPTQETAPPPLPPRPPLPSAPLAATPSQVTPGAAAAAILPFTGSAVESIGGAGAAAATVRCASVGTDSADLRPASRSVFVCTTERKAEEEERARDIREYLKARAAAIEQQRLQERETSAVEVETPVTGERRWPAPPTAVAERIAVLAERKVAAAAAAASTAAPKAVPTRAVASFAGSHNVSSLPDGSTHGSGSLRANGHVGSPLPSQPMIPPVADAGAPEIVPLAFAACSTEGDEDLVAAPTPGSVSDASTEVGARVAAAGTVIALANVPASRNSGTQNSSDRPAPRTAGNADCEVMTSSSAARVQEGRADLGSSSRIQESSLKPAAAETMQRASPLPALVATAFPTGSNSADSPVFGSCVVRPSALQVPSPPSAPLAVADSVASAVAHASPVAPCSVGVSSANAMSTPPAKSPGTTAGAPADLCLFPAWLPQGSCFTLLVTSPRNLTSLEIAAVFEWLLLRTSVMPKPQPQLPQLPTLTIVGARLLEVQPSWHLLPTAAAEAAMAVAPPHARASCDVRVLAVACVPRPGVDPDRYKHELPATAAADAATAAVAAQQLMVALAAVPWSALTAVDDESVGNGTQVRDRTIASGISRGHEVLGGWVSTQPGLQLLFSPIRLRAHAFSQCQPRPSCLGAAISPTTVGCHAATAAAGAVITAVASPDDPGMNTFVSVVAAGGLRNPHLLRCLITRAACLGLTLRGLQVVYATEEAAAAVVAATPHRPLPYTGATLLALSGRNEALRRWQATLGPPDARMASRTDPSSLHALFGDVARYISCSYDSVTAARELSVLFGVTAIGDSQMLSSPSPSPRQQRPQARPPQQSVPQSALHRSSAAAAEASLAAVKSLVGSGTLDAQWLALPAAGALQQANALWCLHHLLWCGYSLRGLLMMCLPGEPHTPQPALVFEVSKEEAIEQLPLLLTALPPRLQTPTAPDGSLATTTIPQQSLLPPEALAACLTPSSVQSLPQPYIAEQLLVAAAGDAALAPAEDRDGYSHGGYDNGGADSSSAGMAVPNLHHGEDGIAVVALQSRPLDAAALLLAALTAHATGCGGSIRTSPQSPDRLELVACRYLRQVPSDVANCLGILHRGQGVAAAASAEGGTASSGGGMVARGAGHRLVISHPALIAVFHGPSAQARVARWLAAGLQRLHGLPEQGIGAAAATSDDSAWEALLNHLRDGAAPAGSTPQLPLIAISSSQATAKRALSYSFAPSQVFLDAGLHDGLHRPSLLAASEAVSSSTASTAAVAGTPLFKLLVGPEPLPAIIALDVTALHRNLLPRLLKQLWREGYVMHAATTCRVQLGSATAAALPVLSGKPAVLLHVSRSNAVQHLRAMASALANPLTGGSAGGLYMCATWRDAVAVVADVWPQSRPHGLTAATSSGSGLSGCALAGRGTTGAAGGLGTPARRFVRPEGSRLLQLTAMVVTPSGPASGESTPTLDWPHVADALEALHSEGFRLAAIRALAATPRDMSDLGRVSCRISPSQQYAIHTSAAAAAAATAAAAARTGHSPTASPQPCNLVLLAIARDSAVTSLQVLLDEAGRAVGEGMRQDPGQLQGAIPGPGGLSALTGRGPGRRETVAALAVVAPCISVAHSPAAAEQQIAAVFEDVFGAGGVPLLQ